MASTTTEGPSSAVLGMMADLSRHRQDELPLDDREKRGPRYAPTGRNGVDHIPKNTMLKLKEGWGNPIRDEESEQMSGLALGDCPWREGRERKSHATRLADPLPLPAPRRPNVSNQGMIMRDNTTIIGGRATAKSSPDTGPNTSNQGVIMRNNSTIVSGRAIAKSSTDTSPAPTPKLPSVSAQTSTAQSDSGQPVKHQQRMADHASHQTFQGAQAKCDIVINTPEEGNITPTWTFYWGSCIVYPNANPERWFVARFEMQMAVSSIENSPTGTLHLAADGLPPRVHAVDKLNHPLLEGKCCILTTKGPVAEASYRLELKDQATTTLFARCLTGLQKTVVFYASKKKDSPTERALPTKKVSPTERASTTGKASPTDLTVEQSSVATSLVDINEPPGNSYATSTSQQAKSQVPESMRDFLKPITYSPETLQKFRGRAVLPAGTPWSPTAGKTNACWESEVWSGKSAVSAPGTSTTSTPSAPSQRRPKMGLSSSMYAN